MNVEKTLFTRDAPRVLVISEFTSLSKEVVKQLIDKGCYPIILSSETDEWTKNFKEEKKVLVLPFDTKVETFLNYNLTHTICIVFSLFQHSPRIKDIQSDLKRMHIAQKISLKNESKTLFVLPYTTKPDISEDQLNLLSEITKNEKFNAGSIFLGDLIPSAYDNNLSGLLQEIFLKVTAGNMVTVAKDQKFYPLSIEKVTPYLLRYLFSLKVYGKRIAILGRKITMKDLNKYFENLDIFNNLVLSQEKSLVVENEVDEKIFIFEKKKVLLRKVLNNFSPILENPIVNKEEVKSLRLPEKKDNLQDVYERSCDNHKIVSGKGKRINYLYSFFQKENLRRRKTSLTLFISVIFLTPIIFTIMSISLVFITKITLPLGYFEISSRQLIIASFFSKSATNYSEFFGKVPLVGELYKEIGETATVLTKEADLGMKCIKLLESTINLADNIFGNDSSDDTQLSNTIYMELENVYRELGFIESEVQTSNFATKIVSNWIVKDSEIKNLREQSLKISKIFQEARNILGGDSQRKYALLFQNNSVARGAGGIIESATLLSFEDSKITNISIFDTTYTDSKLVGRIEPPTPLKKYFDTSTWYFRDASWDPDFPTVATQAEWFLDKGLDEKVDGVVSVDASFLSELIFTIGGVMVDGYEEKVRNNFLTVLREHNKTVHLNGGEYISTNILRKLFETGNVSRKDKIKILKLIFKSLENKDIQIFVNNQNTQRFISDLGWDGSLTKKACTNNCFSDFVGLIESAKEGDSLSVKREAELEISLEKNLIKRKATLFLENDSDAKYQTYLRLFTNFDSGFSQVEIVGKTIEKKDLELKGLRNSKEAGVFVEIPTHEAKAVVFKWESGSNHIYEKEGEYILLLGKQAGVTTYPVKVKILPPPNLTFSQVEPFTLTEGGSFEYNTELSQDKLLKFTWQGN